MNNAELVGNLKEDGTIESERVGKAMQKVDRANYVLEDVGFQAYSDSPQDIGYGQTISAPHMHAHAAENLLPYLKPGARVLDVGSGSGYLTAIFHHLVSEDGAPGHVVGIDNVSSLVHMSEENLRKDGLGEALKSGSIKLVEGDGKRGLESDGPYDAIHVGAAARSLPSALVDQLASPGRMFVPIGTTSQTVFQVDKDEKGNIATTEILDVRYVPFT